MAKRVKYNPDFCEQLVAHCKDGYTIEQFAAVIGCARSAIYQWIDKHEDFAEAHQRGLKLLEMEYMRTMRGIARGEIRGNFHATKWLLNNVGMKDEPVVTETSNTIKVEVCYALTKPTDDEEEIKD